MGEQSWSASQPTDGPPLQQQHSARVGLRASRGEAATRAAKAIVMTAENCMFAELLFGNWVDKV
jgi:hypothetical protein